MPFLGDDHSNDVSGGDGDDDNDDTVEYIADDNDVFGSDVDNRDDDYYKEGEDVRWWNDYNDE